MKKTAKKVCFKTWDKCVVEYWDELDSVWFKHTKREGKTQLVQSFRKQSYERIEGFLARVQDYFDKHNQHLSSVVVWTEKDRIEFECC